MNVQGVRGIRCSELDDVIMGLSIKMGREGFRRRVGRYRRTEEVGPGAWMGSVKLLGG